MKIAATIAMAALAVDLIHAKETVGKSAEQAVLLCMQVGADTGLHLAQISASKMFAEIGVRLEWLQRKQPCGSGVILINLRSGTPQEFHRGALAFALPYEGAHIEIFYDRIKRFDARSRPFVLAHVLVHEISHVLEGFITHSKTGVMKAEWDGVDFDQMVRQPLAFTEQDVGLIHLGLTTRASRIASLRRETRSRHHLL